MQKMTIATALRRIAVLKGDINRFKAQVRGSAEWQNDAKPAFDANSVMRKIQEAKTELVDLKAKIAKANIHLEGKLTLHQIVFELSEIKDTISFIEGIHAGTQKEVVTESQRHDYVDGKSVFIPVKTTQHFLFSEAEKEEELDKLRARATELNQVLERNNHTIEL
jgi:hypothetical protein